MKRLWRLNKFFISLLTFFFVFLATTKPAAAIIHESIAGAIFNWVGDIAAQFITAIVGIFVGIINTVIGLVAWALFWVAGEFISFGLAINSQLAQSVLIKEGFDIVLSFANLGIIVSIVVIAFMIMLRRGNAGELLSKFILVAILINFGLVITTNLLIKPVDEITGIINDATNFNVGSFARAFIVPISFGDEILAPPSGSEGIVQVENTADSVPGLWAGIVINLSSVLFSVMFMVMGTIVMFGFAGILFVRYIALGVLLILLPIAWLSYIFPGLKMAGGHPFQVWWASFFKWLIFAPVSMFFFYLAVRAVGRGALTGPGTFNLLSDAGAALGDMIIAVGLMVGGMIVANRMGIYGASGVMKATGKVTTYVKGIAKTRAVQVASTPLRTEKARERIEGMQKATGVRRAFGYRIMGQQLNVAGAAAEKRVNEAAKRRFKGMDPKRIAGMTPTLHGAELKEALISLQKEKALGLADMKKLIGDEKTKKLFNRYGQGKDYEKIEKSAGFNTAMVKALEAKDHNKLQEETEKFHKTYGGNDIRLIEGGLFKDPNNEENVLNGFTSEEFKDLRKAAVASTFQNIPGAVAKIRTQLDHDSLINFQNELEKAIEDMENDLVSDLKIDKNMFENAEVKQKVKIIQEVRGVEAASVASSLYGSRKSFGSSIFGTLPTGPEATQSSSEETT